MPNDSERERDREADLQRAIRRLQAEIVNSSALNQNEDIRMLLGHMAVIVGILNSEYGTQMRILDRMDRKDRIDEERMERLHKLLDPPNGQDCVSLRDVYMMMRGWRRYRSFVIITLTGLTMSKIFEWIPKISALIK